MALLNERPPSVQSLGGQICLRFETSDVNYLDIHVHIDYMDPFDNLRGHYSLQIASEVKFGLCDLHFTCDQNLPLPYISLVQKIWK